MSETVFSADILIEQAVAGAISAVSTLSVRCFTVPVPEGETREEPSSMISVTAAFPRSEDQPAPVIEVDVAVTLRVTAEDDPDGSLFAAERSALANLILSWRIDLDAACGALSVTGFDCDGVSLPGGSEPSWEETDNSYTLSLTVTVVGRASLPVETEPEAAED